MASWRFGDTTKLGRFARRSMFKYHIKIEVKSAISSYERKGASRLSTNFSNSYYCFGLLCPPLLKEEPWISTLDAINSKKILRAKVRTKDCWLRSTNANTVQCVMTVQPQKVLF